MKRVGLVARATTSGLGYLSKSFDDAIQPSERLVVTDCDPRYQDHINWFLDCSTFVRYADMDAFPYERFLGGIDVLWSYETFYSRKLLETARRMGVKTILMGMPELTRRKGHRGFIGDPDLYVWPTSWRVNGEMILPVPTEPFSPMQEPGETLRVLHVAGAMAVGDRNGTDLFLKSLQYVKSEVIVRIAHHGRFVIDLSTVPAHIGIEQYRDSALREEFYSGCDVLVLPRRYGGLSLPVLEAASQGMAVVMSDCEPNREYPAQVLPCRKGPTQLVPVGRVPTYVVEPKEIAHAIDTLANNPDVLASAQAQASRWAQEHSWENLRPRYDEVLSA